MSSLYALKNIQPNINKLEDDRFNRAEISLSMLRLDEIHPIVSGNKIFKLYYFLNEAASSAHKTIVTFGGAYSNHLAAAAFACKKEGIRCIGIVRGEKPNSLSHTLLFCLQNGMQLEFISRAEYDKIDSEEFCNGLTEKYGDHTMIPEGGFSLKGVKGAGEITHLFAGQNYSHICCPAGTATTFAGLINGAGANCEVIGFSALRNMKDIGQRLKKLKVAADKKYVFNENYHFGGYAKKTPELIAFMNSFFESNKIPLDFVYTGKMMFGVNDLINKNYFNPGSNILCIHTGGLQGNRSLPEGILNF